MIGAEALWNDKIKDNSFLLVNPVYGAQVLTPQQNASLTQLVQQQQAQLRNVRSDRLPSVWQPASLTQEQKDLMDAKAEVERICKEVKDQYELYDWVASNEVEAIAPGWKE